MEYTSLIRGDTGRIRDSQQGIFRGNGMHIGGAAD